MGITSNKNQYRSWKAELQELIDQNVNIRMNGKVASNKTQADRAQYLFAFFTRLRTKGYATLPHNIKQKHIQLECQYMEESGLSAATIQTYLMHLRALARWIGKDGMVKEAAEYFKNPEITKRTYAAQQDKSWTGQGIDIQAVLEKVKADDKYVWIQLLVEVAFGLRRKEAISIRPYIHFVNEELHVVDGSKGGKPRVIPVENDLQRYVREEARKFVGMTSARISHPELTLKQEIKKYANVMQKHGITKKSLGVTGHGLRHEYAHQFMQSQGLTPYVKGEQQTPLDPDEEKRIRLETAQRLGHNRVVITTAYSGTPNLNKPALESKEKRVD